MLFGAQACAEGLCSKGGCPQVTICGLVRDAPAHGDAVTWCQIPMEQADFGRTANGSGSGSDDTAFCSSEGGVEGLMGYSHLSALCPACFLSASFRCSSARGLPPLQRPGMQIQSTPS